MSKEVEVVNTPDNPVPVTMYEATVPVANDSKNPVPVDLGNATPTIGNDQKTLFQFQHWMDAPRQYSAEITCLHQV